MIYDHVFEMVTDNMFLALPDFVPGSETFLKLEGVNPAGSIKLKTAVGLIEDAERSGRLGVGGRIIESSSGSLGIALSQVAASKGYSFTCVTDPNASPQSVALMRALGATVVVVDERDANGGFLGTRIEFIQRRLADDPDLVWPNQYANLANPAVHASRTARSILAELGPVDFLFIGAGTTGTAMGCAQHFRRYAPHTKLIAVDSVGSVTFGSPPGPRRVPGLGTSRTPDLCRPELLDEVIMVEEADAIAMCRWAARTIGLAVGGSTGSVLAAVRGYAPILPRESRVVAISPDLGDRYTQTIYNDEWVSAHFDLAEIDRISMGGQPVVSGELA